MAGIRHPWNVSPDEARHIQETLRKRIILFPLKKKIRRIGAGDVAYAKSDDRLFGAVVIVSFPDLIPVERSVEIGRGGFPYMPGFLGFRECPVLLAAAKRIQTPPEVWIFDGQGIAHPRGLGLASHMGLLLDAPSIGCAKKRLFGSHEAVGFQGGEFQDLTAEGRTIGAVVRTRQGVKPLYVSPGFRIDLHGAIDLVLKTSIGYRTPEPLRQAHLLSKEIRNTTASD